MGVRGGRSPPPDMTLVHVVCEARACEHQDDTERENERKVRVRKKEREREERVSARDCESTVRELQLKS